MLLRDFTRHEIPGFALILILSPLARAQFATEAVEGFTQPYRTIEVAAGESGIVEQIAVREGDRVKAGQLLATLDRRALSATLELAKARLANQGRMEAAKAESRLQKQIVEGLEHLAQDGHARRVELDRARAGLAVAEANQLAAAEEQQLSALECKRIESLLDVRSVKSPIDGIVVKIHRQESEFTPAHDPRLLTVVDLNALRVEFAAPPKYAALLAIGQSLLLELPETRNTVRGDVEFVAPMTDAESGTVRVKVKIDNAKGQCRAGARCLLPLDRSQPDQSSQLRARRFR